MLLELSHFLILCFFSLYYFYYRPKFQYWRKKRVPCLPTISPAGNLTKVFLGKENIFITVKNLYDECRRRGYNHAGLYFGASPVYFPIDPDLINRIFTTDFEYFTDRGAFIDVENYPLTQNLFTQTGNDWRQMRKTLSPIFTSARMKKLYHIFQKETHKLITALDSSLTMSNQINIKKMSSCFTSDAIFTSFFGLEGNTLTFPDSELAALKEKILFPSMWSLITTFLSEGLQNPAKIIKVWQNNKSVENFFAKLVRVTLDYYTKNNILYKDFFSVMLLLKHEHDLTFNQVLGQLYGFFLAGFETSAHVISFCIHELAHNLKVQQLLREEIFKHLGSDYKKFPFEVMLDLPYLDNVINETIRRYPVMGFFNRICVKPYKVPGTNVILDKGTPVLVSSLGLQLDEEYFPEPLKFNPDRFKSKIPSGVFMPFGDGPRLCFGQRYGLLTTKLAIAALVSQFKFTPSSKTPRTIELDRLRMTIFMTPKAGINVEVSKLD